MKSWSNKTSICLTGLLLAVLMASTIHAAPLSFQVDAERTIAPVPDLLTSSIWVQQINETEQYVYERFFSENKPAVVQLSLPVLAGTKSSADARQVMRTYLNSPAARALIAAIRSSDSLLVVGFDPCPMPAWLSARAGDKRSITGKGSFEGWATMESCSPPRDYAAWGEVVTETLRYFNKDLHIRKLGYYVGHEQELQWAGSEQDFFTYYGKTAEAVKRAGRDILVGGAGPAIWNKGKYGCEHLNPEIQGICRQQGWSKDAGNEPFLERFIDHIGRTKLPLDFVNLHSFGTIPRNFLTIAGSVKGWLAAQGLQDTPIYISDWTAWDGPYPSPALDTEEAAAYIPQALYYMWKAGVSWHGHDFNVRNSQLEKREGTGTFTGDWPLFTRDLIFKPSYNAFKAVTLFSGDRTRSSLLEVNVHAGSNVIAFGSRQGSERIAVLVSYFVPGISSVMFKTGYLLELLKQENMFKNVEPEIDAAVACVRNEADGQAKKDRIQSCMGSISSRLDPERKRSLEAVFRVYAAFSSPRPLEQLRTVQDQTADSTIKRKIGVLADEVKGLARTESVHIQASNLPFSGKVLLSTYLIDQDHANPCAANRKTGAATGKNMSCGSGGVIDQQVAEAKLAALRDGADVLKRDLDRSGLDERRISSQKMQIDQCVSSRTYAEAMRCLKGRIGDNRELKNRLKSGLEAFERAYGKRAQDINDLASAALTPVQRTVDIAGRGLSTDVELKPNSVMLLVIEKGSR